jgi:hypothetical protein
VLLTAGLVLAVAATLGAFLTDDPRYLRVAVVAAAWGFAAAAFVAVRRKGDAAAVLAREAELRRAYERELDLEAAARREFELELENDLRQRAEAAIQDDLGYLRADIAALDRVREELGRAAAGKPAELAALRGELASLSALRDDVASLSALRADLTALASLRDDVAALGVLRADLGQLAELRADVSRLRADIVEQLNSEMLVERIIMRTQATRKPGEGPPAGTAPGGLDAAWDANPPSHQLTGSWSSIRFDEPKPTLEYQRVRPVSSPAEPRTRTFPLAPEPDPEPARTPLEWLADRSLLDPDEVRPARAARHSSAAPLSAGRPEPIAPQPSVVTEENPVRPVPYRRRRTDDSDTGRRTDSAEATTVERRAPAATPPLPTYATRPDPAPETDGHARLAEILAENGSAPPSGRRRHRYREDDEPDDVLSRVLRQQ